MFPVSYFYISARLGRPVSEEFAIRTFMTSDPDMSVGDRPLILWCLGHLGMWDTLERICKLWPSKRDQEAEYWRSVASQAQYLSAAVIRP